MTDRTWNACVRSVEIAAPLLVVALLLVAAWLS